MFLLNGKKFNPYASFTSNGIQYTSNWFATASPVERLAVGITEVPDPIRPDDRFYYVQDNDDGTITSVAKDLEPIKEQFKNDIDVACGNVRESVVSKGLFIEEEYRVAYDDAVGFKNAGYTGVVPQSVQTWADVAKQTPQWAADDIISTRDGYLTLLCSVRDIRLRTKAAIDGATTPEEILIIFHNFNSTVALYPQV